MKLQWPFKDYTEDQIKNVHGDERMRRLVANDTRTSGNILAILMLIIPFAILLFVFYSLYESFFT